MVLILLSVFCNHDNWRIKLYQKKSYLDEGLLFIGKFKVGKVLEMINKEALAQFLHKPAWWTENLFTPKNFEIFYFMYI